MNNLTESLLALREENSAFCVSMLRHFVIKLDALFTPLTTSSHATTLLATVEMSKKLMVEDALCAKIFTVNVDGIQQGKPWIAHSGTITKYEQAGYTICREDDDGFKAAFDECDIVPGSMFGSDPMIES